jgi:hypothetical protein
MSSETSPRLETSRLDLVIVGRFAPDEAVPEALASAKVISSNEAQKAVFKNLVAGKIAEFSLTWGTLQTTEQRLIAQTSEAPYVRIADLAIKVIKEAQTSPFVTMFGVNREFVYKYSSIADRDQLGMRLSPPSAWGKWGTEVERNIMSTQSEPIKHGGLMNASMRQIKWDDRENGWVDVTVSSILGTSTDGYGVTIRVNDHYQFSDEFDPKVLSDDGHRASRTDRLLDALVRNFDASIDRAESIVNGLVQR